MITTMHGITIEQARISIEHRFPPIRLAIYCYGDLTVAERQGSGRLGDRYWYRCLRCRSPVRVVW